MKSIGIFIFLIALSTIVTAQKKRTVFDDVNFKVEPASFINTVASDIAPTFVNDSIYFSGVSEKYFNKTKREKRNMDFYNIYSASIDPRGIVSSSRSLVPGFGNDFHEGPTAYCEATGELFVTVSNTTDFEEIQKMIPVENIRLRLVIKKRIDGKWQIVEELPFNNKRFHFAQPAISVTGDTLVFSSDLNTVNYGKSDLFMSVRKNGEWNEPVNLGNLINTAGSEMFPTFIQGGILSFASNGRTPNNGGLDIYYARFPELNKVEILDNEINSPSDDFGLIIHKNGSIGYFTSNRKGTRSDDIFKVNFIKLYRIFRGRTFDSNTNRPLANTKITLKNCNGDILNSLYSDSIGNFSFEVLNNECLQVEIIRKGFENELNTISGLSYFDFRLKTKKHFDLIVLDADDNNPVEGVSVLCNDESILTSDSIGILSFIPPFPDNCGLLIKKEGYLTEELTPNNLFRDGSISDTIRIFKKELNKNYFLGFINSVSGELKILREATPVSDELIRIMKLNPDLKVELGWHTDSMGDDSENKRLSQNRADFAIKYMVNNGIEKNRIVGKGYGESQLVNKCKNGVECTEEEHRANRRIEFKIVDFLKL